MAFFKINKLVLNDPPTLGAIQREFKNIVKYTPFVDNLYDWYKVNGPGLPDDSVEIELTFELINSNTAKVIWKPKNTI